MVFLLYTNNCIRYLVISCDLVWGKQYVYKYMPCFVFYCIIDKD